MLQSARVAKCLKSLKTQLKKSLNNGLKILFKPPIKKSLKTKFKKSLNHGLKNLSKQNNSRNLSNTEISQLQKTALKLDKVFCVLDDICWGRATPFQWTGGMTGHSPPLTPKVRDYPTHKIGPSLIPHTLYFLKEHQASDFGEILRTFRCSII